MHAEIDAVLDGGRLPTLEDLPRLRYTEMVFAESMRLYPPAWAMGRQSIADVELGPYPLSRGHLFLLQPIHHSAQPGIFSRPVAFRSRPLSPREQGRPAALCLFSLRRRRTAMYRRGFRLDGRGSDAGHDGPEMAAAVCPRTNRRRAAQDHAPPQISNDVCARAAVDMRSFSTRRAWPGVRPYLARSSARCRIPRALSPFT